MNFNIEMTNLGKLVVLLASIIPKKKDLKSIEVIVTPSHPLRSIAAYMVFVFGAFESWADPMLQGALREFPRVLGFQQVLSQIKSTLQKY